MLNLSIIFLALAILAAILGFGGLSGVAASIAQILFFFFVTVWLVYQILGRGGSDDRI
ncbi:DUF1328 family protein [Pelagicoccus albus]|uniref:DUF1328 domain-containing protein n=1 Tax=Pelagicoccus albus TaxID=415222 RepID=A0A7X1B3X7_9BACT|nr:DUF1328 family protein [Pelagicoccus albus]MBC2605189.1 DUF1328 domain-containing protein [Pelagicoccus albus]